MYYMGYPLTITDAGPGLMLHDPGVQHRLMLCRVFCHPPYSVEAAGGRATAPVYLYTSLQHGISALVLTGAHNPFSVKNKKKEVLIGASHHHQLGDA